MIRKIKTFEQRLDVIRDRARGLDLRHLTKAYEDRRQWENGHAKTPWQDLVRTRSLQKLIKPISKAEEIEVQKQKVKEAILRFPNDRQKQIEFTGLGLSPSPGP